MVTSARLLINGLYPQGMFTSSSTITSYQALPRQWLDFSPMILPPRKIAECLYCDVGPTSISAVQSCLIKLSTVIQLYHHTSHTYKHTFIHSCIYTFMHIHTYTNHLFIIASTTLGLDSTNFLKKSVIPSASDLKISPSIYFKWHVPQTVRFINTHFQFPSVYPSFITFQLYLYFVSRSPTMTTNTNNTFTFTLCLTLPQWHQTPTLPLFLPCVLLSYNDSRHQHCLLFTLCLTLLQWQ